MPRVNTYEPTELESLEIAHQVVLNEIEFITGDFWIDDEMYHGVSEENEAYHRRLCDSAYWLRTRLGELRQG